MSYTYKQAKQDIAALRLNPSAIAVPARRMDWLRELGSDLNGWRSWQREACDRCGTVFVLSAGGGDLSHADMTRDFCCCDGWIPRAEGPMADYFHELPGAASAERIARAITGRLCAVELRDGTAGLALTRGGMDLSWEIAEAHVAAGYWPPLWISLPRMAGHGATAARLRTVAAVAGSAAIAARWARSAKADADRMAGELLEGQRKRSR